MEYSKGYTMTRKFAGSELLIATHNAGKVAEFQKMLGGNITIKMASDLDLPDVEETGTTYLENAHLKASAGAQFSGLPTLADDSGFAIDALDGRPGLYSARFIKKMGSAEKAFAALHEELGDRDRTARFICVLCLAWPDGHYEHVRGEVVGQFIYPMRGRAGFGYDPLFIPENQNRTFGEMTGDEKNIFSHRRQAIEKILQKCFTQ